MLIVVTEKIVHYKSKVWAMIVFTKLEGSLWSVALGQIFLKVSQKFRCRRVPVEERSKKKFIFDDFASSKNKNHHRRYK